MRMRKKSNLETRLSNAGDKLLFIETHDFYKKPESEKQNMLDIKKIFNNNNPTFLEIGCGKATFSIELAKRRSDINIIAIEKISNVIIEPVENIKNDRIDNLKFLNVSADNLLYYFKEGSISGIFLNFSCPFPKNTYANRRLTNKRFLDIYKKILNPQAKIHQKTDNQKFFEYSLESFSQNGFTLSDISLNLHESSFKDNIVTEYEEYFSSKGQPIYRLVAQLKQ